MTVNKEVGIYDIKTGLTIYNNRDENLKDFGKSLLENFYLRPDETIQEGFARASFAWSNGDKELAQRLYDYVSKGWFMFASPVLSNAPEVESLSPLKFKKTKGMPISCFAAGTPINMEDGSFKNIEDIIVGDRVLSNDGTYNEVLAIDSKKSNDIYEIEIDGEVFTVTGNHLFLTEQHGWVRVDELDEDIHELVSVN